MKAAPVTGVEYDPDRRPGITTLLNESEEAYGDERRSRAAGARLDRRLAGKPDDIPLARDFTHSSPFGVVEGRGRYLEWVKPLAAENVTALEIVKTLGGEGEAVIWFEMTTPKGRVQCCDWVQSAGGEIVAVTSFYDATGLR